MATELVTQPNGAPNRKVLAAWLTMAAAKLYNDMVASFAGGCEEAYSVVCSLPPLPDEVAYAVIGVAMYQVREWRRGFS